VQTREHEPQFLATVDGDVGKINVAPLQYK
jgi:hypothetical protein